MAHSEREIRRRAFLAMLAGVGAMSFQLPIIAANARREQITVKSLRPKLNFVRGTYAGDDLHLVQGSTVFRAGKAEATGAPDMNFDNSTWKLSDAVRLEFDGAVVDAQSAIVVFADGRLKTVEAQPAPAAEARTQQGPVHLEFDGAILDAHHALVNFADNRIRTVRIQGSRGEPARFSHQFRNASRRANGRSATIDYDAARRLIRFSGGTKFSYGTIDSETEAAVYSLADGTFETEAQTTTTIPREERVPPPRTPDRSIAK